MAGTNEHVGRLGVLDDLTGVHDHDIVGHIRNHAEVVGDEDHGHVLFALQCVEQLDDLSLSRHVQRGRGFVRDQEFGRARQGHGDHDSLAHPAQNACG